LNEFSRSFCDKSYFFHIKLIKSSKKTNIFIESTGDFFSKKKQTRIEEIKLL